MVKWLWDLFVQLLHFLNLGQQLRECRAEAAILRTAAANLKIENENLKTTLEQAKILVEQIKESRRQDYRRQDKADGTPPDPFSHD